VLAAAAVVVKTLLVVMDSLVVEMEATRHYLLVVMEL
jgi:hypothetical protein